MNEFTVEQRILLHLLSRSFGSAERLSPELLQQADWEQVMAESRSQAVALLAFDAASEYKESIPPAVYSSWRKLAMNVLANNQRVIEAQTGLLSLLETAEIPCVILKGLAAASYYPKGELRTLGDVDFLIRTDLRQSVDTLLTEHGYTVLSAQSVHHVAYLRDGIDLEMHWEVAGLPHGTPGTCLRQYLCTLPDEFKTQRVAGLEFPVPSPARHGVVILLHMLHHMLGEGLGLRHLYDWAAFVQATCNETFWAEELLPLFREIGLLEYAAAMTRASSLYLGSCCPDFEKSVSEELCREMMDDFFKSGNMGYKDRIRSRSGMMISDHGKAGTRHGKLYNLFLTLHRTTLSGFPVILKIPVLYPFLLGYRVVRYLILQLLGKRPGFSGMLTAAQERKRLYDQLKIYETEDA